MRQLNSRHPRTQRGAVLIVSLVMLAVMTLFVISMLKTSVIELKIGGSSQVASINVANADSAIDNF
ncbi:MAG TPA: PilX N-terminal domain-containing pilus assembly protein, partial [Candidatus Kryptonia bacterium]|nr:PilX N-terminal domain-containing pilus assembly protein [Candidatus Kryptonia bacterium]